MKYSVEVSKGVYWIGVNDRAKHLFENLWPLPMGVSYNSYLIVDQKCALLDTIEMGSDGLYIKRIEAELQGRELDYLIVNHMEPDHSGELDTIVRRWPEVKIVGNKKTFEILNCYYAGLEANQMEVEDGQELDLGEHRLKFVFTPWVHWPETMMTYEINDKILFSADAFGTFGALNGGVFDDQTVFEFYEEEMRRYYSNIVGKYSSMVQRAFAKLAEYEINMICSLHGPIWRKNVKRVIELYDRWSKQETEDGVVLVYASMYGNTASVADYIAYGLAAKGVRNIKVFDVSKTHPSYLISEIWRYSGVILGSCAYNTNMFPLMDNLCRDLLNMGIKTRKLGLFGGYSWNGGGVRNLAKFAEEIKWDLVCSPAEVHGRPTPEKYAQCDELIECMAKRIKGVACCE